MEKVLTTSKQKNILYVESDKSQIRELDDYMIKNDIAKKHGINLILAESAQEATKKMVELKIDLVILEIMLPIVNGYHLINKIKKTNVPIIVFTKLKSTEDLAKIASSGASNMFIKELSKIDEVMKFAVEKDDYKTDLDKLVNELQVKIKSASGDDSKSSVQLVQCPKCNTILAPGSHFCNNCGQKIIAKKNKALKTKQPERNKTKAKEEVKPKAPETKKNKQNSQQK